MFLGLDLGPHAGFIETAYAIAAATVAGTILWVIADHRRQARRLAELEAKGQIRRSERPGYSGKVEASLSPGNATLPPP
jgi:heme exporter protein D